MILEGGRRLACHGMLLRRLKPGAKMAVMTTRDRHGQHSVRTRYSFCAATFANCRLVPAAENVQRCAACARATRRASGGSAKPIAPRSFQRRPRWPLPSELTVSQDGERSDHIFLQVWLFRTNRPATSARRRRRGPPPGPNHTRWPRGQETCHLHSARSLPPHTHHRA